MTGLPLEIDIPGANFTGGKNTTTRIQKKEKK